MKNFIPTLFVLAFLIGFSENTLIAQNSSFPDELANVATVDSRPGWIKLKTEANFNQKSFFDLLNTGDDIDDQKDYQLTNNTTDQFGATRYVFQQTFKNIPIDNEVWLLHSKNDRVFLAQGNTHLPPFENTQTTPAFSAAQGLEKALKTIKPISQNNAPIELEDLEDGIEIIDNQQPIIEANAGTLVWAVDDREKVLKLAYKYDIFTAEPLARKHYYVHAVTGIVFKTVDLLTSNCFHESADAPHKSSTNIGNKQEKTASDVTGSGQANYVSANDGIVNFTTDFSNDIYTLTTTNLGPQNNQIIKTQTANNTTSTANFTDITDSDNFWDMDSVAVGTQWGTELVYDYFLTEHNRNSYDNNGSPLLSIVHFDTDYVNAFWNGSRMTYGDGDGTNWGPLTSFDVIAHEITHGVTEHNGTGGLIYQNESGALNESFSDIFGVVFEFQRHPDGGDWLMGEDFDLADHDGFRNMQNPLLKGHPKTYYGESWFTGTGDNGGVHFNSGVQNYWFYLLSTGGDGTNEYDYPFGVIGIGLDDAAAIAYRNLTTYLHPNATYEDAKDGSIQAAIDLFGENSQQHLSTIEAWCAVGANQTCLPDIDVLDIVDPILNSGTTYDLTWVVSLPHIIEKVKIEYTIETGDNPTWILIADDVDAANYNWTIPNTPSTTVRIRVTDDGSTTRSGNPLLYGESLQFAIESCGNADSFTPPPSVTLNTPLTFIGNLEGDSYEWLINGTTIATTKDLNYTFTDNGVYVLVYRVTINANNCVNIKEQTYSFLPDNVCNAQPIEIGTTYIGSFEGGTVETNEIAPPGGNCNSQVAWCNNTLHRTLWYTFTAPDMGSVQIKTDGVVYSDTQLALYKDMDCTQSNPFQNAVLIAANDDIAGTGFNGSFIEQVCLIPGNTYYVQVDEYSIGQGDFTLLVEEVLGDCEIAPEDNCRLQDSLVLVDIYTATDGANWTNTWDLAMPMSSWYGVTLNELGCVTSLDLNLNNLNGTFLNSLWNLEKLDTLNLAFNPLLKGVLSADIGNLVHLKALNFTNVDLSGNPSDNSLPAEIGDLVSLENLRLSTCQLKGNIPSSIGHLAALTSLTLSNNQLEGIIPESIGNLYALTDLSLANNQLTGAIPSSFANLAALSALDLSTNQLTTIPADVIGMVNLVIFNCHTNQITSLPDLSPLTQLKNLSLGTNLLNGPIPNWIGNLTSLYYLSLYNNQLIGKIPLELSSLNLITFQASDNQLTGMIPDFFGNMSNLQNLQLANNQLEGLVPAFITTPNLKDFEIDGNQFIFENILPNINAIETLIDNNNSTSNQYKYNPQDSIFTDSTINTQAGSSFSIDLLIDDTVTTNIYQWYKDGQLFTTIEGNNALTFGQLKESDEGIYHCEITNPNAPNLTLYSRNITLNVEPNICLEKDSLSLIALYNATDGPNWTNPWDLSQPITTWYGVYFDAEGCVNRLDLDGDLAPDMFNGGNNLSGNLPNDFFDLTNLDTLALSGNNQLGGSLPSAIQNLTNLSYLALSSNSFTNNLPESMGNLNHLEALWIGDNNFTGSIPASLANLTQLNTLNLSLNNFTSIPDLSNLNQLKRFYISNNQIADNLFNWIGNLTNLEEIDIRDNLLTTDISNFSPNWAKIIIVDFSENQLKGVMQNWDAPQLNTLSLQHNQLSDIPDFTDIPSIYYVDIANNSLTFKDIIPNNGKATVYNYHPQSKITIDTLFNKNIGDFLAIDLGIDANVSTNQYKWFKDGTAFITINGFNKLVFNSLDISDEGIYRCEITNPNAPDLTLETYELTLDLTDPICHASDSLALIDLYLATDGANWTNSWDLTMPMETWYGVTLNNRGCVEKLNLSGELNPNCTFCFGNGNNLVGIIPPSIGGFAYLEELRLDKNSLSDTIPSEIGNLANLKILSLTSKFNDDVALTGNLPSEIGQLSSLEILILDDNQLNGTLPTTLNDLTNLSTLSLDHNQFNGNLPDLSMLTELTYFRVSNNELIGTLPDWIYGLTNLEDFYAGGNSFEGELSPNFGQLLKLELLSLYNNQLTGTIPSALGNLSNLRILILDNNQLTGTIPASIANLNLGRFIVNGNQLEGLIPDFSTNSSILYDLQVQDNQYTFEDIAPYAPAIIALDLDLGYTYQPQPKVYKDTLFIKDIGDNLTIYLGVDDTVTTNVYKWYQNNQLLTTINGTNQLNLTNLQPADAGTYHCEITNPNAPDLTLASYSIVLEITPCSTADSLALVEFYLATDGDNWETPWNLNETMNNWEGVVLDVNGCVATLNLQNNNLTNSLPPVLNELKHINTLRLDNNQLTGPIPSDLMNLNLTTFTMDNNHLTGSIPAWISTMNKLRILRLSDNQLTGSVPNFSIGNPNLQDLEVDGNQFTFTDLVPDFLSNQSLIDNNATANSHDFTYAPQDSVYKDTSITVYVGESVTIDLGLDGNIYEWYKDNELVTRIDDNDTFTLHNLQSNNAGVYHCKIKSLLYATQLTLISRPITLIVKDCSISLTAGEQVCDEQNNTFSQAVTITYMDAPSEGMLMVNDQSYPITGSPQTVILTDLTPNASSTAVTASFSALPSCSHTVNNLFTAPESCVGTCEATDMIVNDPIESKTYQASNTLSSNGTVEQDFTTTFKAGQTITLAAGFHAVAGSNFTAQIVLCEDAATLETPTAEARTATALPNSLATDLMVRPNPFHQHTTIEYTLTENQTVSLAVYSATGQLIKTFVAQTNQDSGYHSYDFDASQLKGGMYVVVLQTEAMTTVKKIVLID